MPFARRVCFVDVETTGSSPAHGRVTEVGVVSVWRDDSGDDGREAGALQVEEWSSLVNPGTAIPPEIQFLTGISNAMVADAPPFAEIAPQLADRLRDAIFVAHHARFDYGFLRSEFARAGVGFSAKTLCTVRLSRLMDPDRSPHSLDAIIHRHGLSVTDRHRALGDARVLWDFLRKLYARRGTEEVDAAIRRLLKQPSLPAHLPPNTLTDIPRAPGVYLFYGLNEHPLYIGKSINLRERVGSHFVADWRSERGMRLASETQRIEWEETAGDLGAQLRERALIRTRMPAHNVALRRRRSQVLLALDPDTARITWRKAEAVTPESAPGLYGPFGSRPAARRMIEALAPASGLCLRCLKLERGAAGTPCFNRQLGRCAGACVGVQSAPELASRLAEALAPHRVPAWPFDGPVALVERNDARGTVGWQVFDRWCWLGTAADAAGAEVLAREAPRQFDPDDLAMLRRLLEPGYDAEQALAPERTAARESERAPDEHTEHDAGQDSDAPRSSEATVARPAFELIRLTGC